MSQVKARIDVKAEADLEPGPRMIVLKLAQHVRNSDVEIGRSSRLQDRPAPIITGTGVTRAPRAGAKASPSEVPAIPRGAPARVEFFGERFDETAQVIAEDPNIIITQVAYSADTGSVLATITAPANGRTGRSRFQIKTEGGESNFVELGVRHRGGGGGDPELIQAYPSTIAAGASTEVTLSSDALDGAQVVIDPPHPGVIVSTQAIDANTLQATFDTPASVSEPVTLFAESAGAEARNPSL